MGAYTGPFPFTNQGTVSSIAVTDTTVSGSITNLGSITPGGITVTDSTINGYIVDNGPTIAGGISLDSASQIISNSYFGILVEENFAGGITNSGSITALYSAIDVDGVATFGGGIVNTGTLAAGADGIDLSGATFSGGVSNGGTITAANTGISVFYATFSGGISNSGTINAVNGAIDVDSRTFSGGISNGGIITSVATAIDLVSITAFSGGISNSGTVSSTFDEGISVAIITEFSGNIVNSGNILSGDADGIEVQRIQTFAGAISNGGTINTFDTGIDLASVSTFTGGITNSGIISAADDPGILLNVMSMFSGGVSNSGTISSAGDQGIEVESVSVFSGGVSNSGTIDADFTGINLVSDSAFSGGVANSGSINSHLDYGINVEAVTTFSGGITNNGNVAAADIGIAVNPASVFSGGISNFGTVTAAVTGISIRGATFLGDIVNNGSITGSEGVNIFGNLSGGITNNGAITGQSIGIAFFNGTFSGNIVNNKTINGGNQGIAVQTAAAFDGTIVNTGTIDGTNTGISVNSDTLFNGGITNSGTINGAFGIFDAVSTFIGAISNSGTIVSAATAISSALASVDGSIVNSGYITGADCGIDVVGVTMLTGGITNTGSIDAAVGILARNYLALGRDVSPVRVFDSGSIVGTSGTAVDLSQGSGGNTFTLGPGYSITGNVAGSGSDTFQLGGAGSGSFNLNNLGTQYTGFSTFDVVSGTWTVTGTFSQFAPWTVAGGTLIEDGTLSVGATVENIGTLVLSVGSNVAGAVTLESGATLEFDSSFTYQGPITIAGDADFAVAAGQTVTLASPVFDGATPGELTKIGAGTLVLNDQSLANDYTGGTFINAGTLEIGSGSTVAGNITFAATDATLRLDNGTNQIGGTIAGAVVGDAVDLRFQSFTTGDKAVWTQNGGTGTLDLETSAGTILQSVTLAGAYVSNEFAVAGDNNGGTVIEIVGPPTISGTMANQTTTTEAPVHPFSGVTITDPNAGAIDTLTIRLSSTSGKFGTLSGTGLTGSGDTYQLSGSTAAITAELHALSFIPVDGVPNTSVSTTFAFSDQSTAFAAPVTDNTTSVIDTDPANPPVPAISFPHVANSNVDEWILTDGEWAASAEPGSIPSGYQVAGTGDFTGNGTSDILWFSGTTGDTQEWLINNGGWAGTVDLGTHPGNYQIAGVGHFFGNGIDDVLWTSATGSGVQTDIWELGSNGQWVNSVSPGSHPAGYNVVGIGDFTGNGTSDILWENPTTGDVDEWQIANGQWSASVDLGAHPGSDWTIAGVGDFTGNGIDDILWTNSSGGQVQTDIWELGPNGRWEASVSPGAHPAGYNVVGIGNFSGNGTSDILWQDAATGNLDEWLINNGRWSASIDLGSHPGNFQIAGTGSFVNGNATSDILWHSPS